MGALWLVGLILFVGGPVAALCLVAGGCRKPAPAPPLRLVEGGLGRVWRVQRRTSAPEWWGRLDGWRDELGDGAA